MHQTSSHTASTAAWKRGELPLALSPPSEAATCIFFVASTTAFFCGGISWDAQKGRARVLLQGRAAPRAGACEEEGGWHALTQAPRARCSAATALPSTEPLWQHGQAPAGAEEAGATRGASAHVQSAAKASHSHYDAAHLVRMQRTCHGLCGKGSTHAPGDARGGWSRQGLAQHLGSAAASCQTPRARPAAPALVRATRSCRGRGGRRGGRGVKLPAPLPS